MSLPTPDSQASSKLSATDNTQRTRSSSARSEPVTAPLRPAGMGQPPRTLDSQSLLGGANLVLIAHQGETYRLQTTRQGKLILTK